MTVTYNVADAVAVITIDRVDRRNAINRATAEALGDAWRRFEADESALVGVLTGAGGHFSAGADLKSFDLVDDEAGFLGFTRMEVDKPTIAAIEGYCVAGGLEMALWCDLRVAARSAIFGCFERRFGVPLVDGGTQRLPHIVGLGRALDMILTGREVDASEALAIGLVNRVVEAGQALTVARSLGTEIAHFPQATLRSDRRAAHASSPIDLELERRLGTAAFTQSGADPLERFREGEGRAGQPV
jgi:enoyl-CoA hydratase